VREPETPTAAPDAGRRLALSDIGELPLRYWWIVGVAAVMTLARFSEAFLVLRAQSVGMPLQWIPLVMALMSIVYAVAAYPAGVLADRGRQQALLQIGLLALIVADFILADADGAELVLAGTAVWGVHMGLTQGVLAALVAATAPAALRGTAFGIFNLVSGVALLGASVLAGWLWVAFGPAETFYAGAGFALLAMLALAAGSRLLVSRA